MSHLFEKTCFFAYAKTMAQISCAVTLQRANMFQKTSKTLDYMKIMVGKIPPVGGSKTLSSHWPINGKQQKLQKHIQREHMVNQMSSSFPKRERGGLVVEPSDSWSERSGV